MKADSIHKYRKAGPTAPKKNAASIFVNSPKNHKRRLQRIDFQTHAKKEIDPKVEKELMRKIKKERIRDNVVSVMFGIVLTFILLSLLYWVAMK